MYNISYKMKLATPIFRIHIIAHASTDDNVLTKRIKYFTDTHGQWSAMFQIMKISVYDGWICTVYSFMLHRTRSNIMIHFMYVIDERLHFIITFMWKCYIFTGVTCYYNFYIPKRWSEILSKLLFGKRLLTYHIKTLVIL